MTRIVEAAAAVILQPDGRFLLGQRPEGKPYAGYWEFPGGKIEPGETAAQALVRELHEELGIEADRYTPWITREFVYPHAHVRLHFFRVAGWHGEIRDIHHAALAWRRADNVDVAPLLPANLAVLRGLTLPEHVAEKLHFSCVAAKCLDGLPGSERPQVVVAGTESHVCVLQTVLDLRAQGKEVFVVADAVGSRKPTDKELALARMRGHGVQIVSREMVAFEWLKRAGTDEFRAVSQEFLK